MNARLPETGIEQALAIIERMGGPALVAKIVAMFGLTARERVERMRRLLASDDRVQLARLGHALKGSAAQVGAETLRDLCASLERDAVRADRDELASVVTAIACATGETIAMLEAAVGDGTP